MTCLARLATRMVSQRGLAALSLETSWRHSWETMDRSGHKHRLLFWNCCGNAGIVCKKCCQCPRPTFIFTAVCGFVGLAVTLLDECLYYEYSLTYNVNDSIDCLLWMYCGCASSVTDRRVSDTFRVHSPRFNASSCKWMLLWVSWLSRFIVDNVHVCFLCRITVTILWPVTSLRLYPCDIPVTSLRHRLRRNLVSPSTPLCQTLLSAFFI
jgi:hypothetical protein